MEDFEVFKNVKEVAENIEENRYKDDKISKLADIKQKLSKQVEK